MRQYQVGDEVWWANYGMREVRLTCPVCFGNRKVTLILGNDDEIILPCTYCGRGFEDPKGYVIDHQCMSEVELVTISEVRTRSSIDGTNTVEYIIGTNSGGARCLDPKDIFDTKEEAIARAFAKTQEDIVRKETMAEYVKGDRHRSYAWNAGYHMREARRNRTSAEYHERMVVVCKSRAKKESS